MLTKLARLWRRDAGEAAAAARLRAEELKLDGNRLLAAGDLAAAKDRYMQAVAADPRYAEAHNNLGIVLDRLGECVAARASLEQALAIDPRLANAHYNLATVLQKQGEDDSALEHLRRAVELSPQFESAHLELVHGLFRRRRIGDARRAVESALAGLPASAGLRNYLGNLSMEATRIDEAIAAYRAALTLQPDFAEAQANLGLALQTVGRLDEAVASYRRALAIKPDYAVAHSNLIFAVDLAAGETTATQLAERRRWDAVFAAPLRRQGGFANVRDPERRLRIGYVSADFRMHSASTVFDAMLCRYDRERFEVFAYSNNASEDAVTRKFKAAATAWRNIVDVDDESVAATIRDDAIDILVDLSGHSSGNRLLVFARKPAPIQITAWGYATSTGMSAMDVFFADPIVVPPEEKTLFVEQVRYLPCVACYTPPQPLPGIAPLPAASAGTVTFGSFNRIAKIGDDTFRLWARVLAAVPGSRMIVKAYDLDSQAVRERIAAHFTAAGIEPQRIEMIGKTPWAEHMAAFGRIDIALDPFPHGGGVTTAECLLMGVPVVTLRWPTIVGRLSASMLTAMGLTDWIAETQEQYVALAAAQATQTEALARLRSELRERFNTSALGDAATYVKAVEDEYRELWRQWCQGGEV